MGIAEFFKKYTRGKMGPDQRYEFMSDLKSVVIEHGGQVLIACAEPELKPTAPKPIEAEDAEQAETVRRRVIRRRKIEPVEE